MEVKDAVSIIAILVGPVFAVLITLWWQQWKEKRDRKLNLFTVLMAHRRSLVPTNEWVNALNLIDVVFADHPKVVALWHDLYVLLYTSPPQEQAKAHKYLELLSAMAIVLGFPHLQQTDIDKFYIPQVHIDSATAQAELQAQLLRVLQNTEALLVLSRQVKEANGLLNDLKP